MKDEYLINEVQILSLELFILHIFLAHYQINDGT